MNSNIGLGDKAILVVLGKSVAYGELNEREFLGKSEWLRSLRL